MLPQCKLLLRTLTHLKFALRILMQGIMQELRPGLGVGNLEKDDNLMIRDN